MHPRNINRIDDAIKSQDDDDSSYIITALNKTGYDLDDVSVLTCIPKFRLIAICQNRTIPTDHEKMLLSSVLPLDNLK
jgi:hypothetical protein